MIQENLYHISYFRNPCLLLIGLLCLSNCKDKPISEEQVVVNKTNESEVTTNESIKSKKKSILFFGDSLTAGYGLSEEESFPSLVQDRIDSLDLPYQVINAGLSGETSAGGVGRIDWVLQQPVDIFVLELGANDMLRGLDVKETESNLDKIIESVKNTYPDAQLIVVGMESPPNMGEDYVKAFNALFAKLAKKHSAGFLPFLLKGVDPSQSIGDGKHPNAEGQKIVLENVWEVLEPYL